MWRKGWKIRMWVLDMDVSDLKKGRVPGWPDRQACLVTKDEIFRVHALQETGRDIGEVSPIAWLLVLVMRDQKTQDRTLPLLLTFIYSNTEDVRT